MKHHERLLPGIHPEMREAGCDEAGRGCIAGPVTAAAVILPVDFYDPLLDDSKKISHKNRLKLKKVIEKNAIAYHVAFIDNKEIDKRNILKASIMAMHFAIKGLGKIPEWLLIDGNRFYQYKNIPHTCVIKGDGKYLSIAAASILAKTYRDEYMLDLHAVYPQYNWSKNKGYPTKEHRNAVERFGLTPYHRRSFSITNTQLKITF